MIDESLVNEEISRRKASLNRLIGEMQECLENGRSNKWQSLDHLLDEANKHSDRLIALRQLKTIADSHA